MKTIIILGASGFVGRSLNDFIKVRKIKKYKIINFSRSENKNIIKINKLPKANYIIYCLKNKNIKISLKYFNHFKKLLDICSKKVKILFLSSGAVYGPRLVKSPALKTKIIVNGPGLSRPFCISRLPL